nr:MAG TPA: hypothetical protein [Caudoviricetes sp.]
MHNRCNHGSVVLPPHPPRWMYLHLPVRVVLSILHLCIQVDLHRTLVPSRPRTASSLGSQPS